MTNIRYKQWQRFVFLLTLAVFFVSFYVQYQQHIEPCPLCLMQRFCAALLILGCVIAVCIKTIKFAKALVMTQILFAALGVFFATRQLWLQSLPAENAPACLPTLDVMLQYFPLRAVVQTLLWGSGNCAEVTWLWFGLSMAAWSLVYFSIVFAVSSALLWTLSQRPKAF